MKKELVTLKKERFFTGITVTTNNKKAAEEKSIINIIQKYFTSNTPALLQNRTNPGVTLAIYTDYESNHTGNYLYGIGEEVEHLNTSPQVQNITIPAGTYLKITTPKGPIEKIALQTWQAIWRMEERGTLGGERTYNVDFEVWDERMKDPTNACYDIYLGIKKT